MRVIGWLFASIVLGASTQAQEIPGLLDEILEGAPEETTGDVTPPEEESTADIIVIGSGPGGTGFLRRLTEIRPELSVLWFDKGLDKFLAKNWPEDIAVNTDVIDPIPREKLNWLTAYAWNAFGGGDAGSSGGPNYLGTDRSGSGRDQVYDEVDVFELRNNSVTPLTPTSSRWEQAFLQSGFSQQNPLKDRSTGANEVGSVSSIRTADGTDRLLIAGQLRDDNTNNIDYVHARIMKINTDGSGRATGVTGIRLASDQSEVGEVTTWTARKAVVLAAGVFNSFDLLVESGIGPEEYLQVRGVPLPWWSTNEQIGKGVGDEPVAVFATIEPEPQNPLASEPSLVAQNTDDTSFTYWSTGVFEWFRFSGFLLNYLAGDFLSGFLPYLAPVIQAAVGRGSIWGIGIKTEPAMSLKAVQKLANGTLGFDRNPLGIILDDSDLEFTSGMCAALNNSLPPFRKYLELQREVRGFNLIRSAIDLLTSLGVFNIIQPNAILEGNIDTYTNNGQDCRLQMLASYYHFYGGNTGAVDDSYLVDDTTNLYISDASILSSLAPGAPSTAVMQEGMRVADAVSADFLV